MCTMRNDLAILVVVFEFHDNFPNWVGQYPNVSNFLLQTSVCSNAPNYCNYKAV